jgi:RNA polymerase sigma-70 factor (ECF subfamily)
MPLTECTLEQRTAKDASFATTHWSTVLLTGQTGSPQAEAALAKLCQTYWYPLYVFVRRQGHSPEDAEDLVQGFFARVLEKDYLKGADPAKGKFRSFLLMMLKRYMANEWDRANRQKRGSGQTIISLDADTTELRYQTELADEMTPERAFERQWALTLLQQVLEGLETEYRGAGRAQLFEALKALLSGGKADCSYAEIGQRLGTTEGTVKVTVHRLRRRYRQLLKQEIAHTVSGPEEVEEEIRELFAVLG